MDPRHNMGSRGKAMSVTKTFKNSNLSPQARFAYYDDMFNELKEDALAGKRGPFFKAAYEASYLEYEYMDKGAA